MSRRDIRAGKLKTFGFEITFGTTGTYASPVSLNVTLIQSVLYRPRMQRVGFTALG